MHRWTTLLLPACCFSACGGEAAQAREPEVPVASAMTVPSVVAATPVAPPPPEVAPPRSAATVTAAESPQRASVSLHAAQHNEMCVDASASRQGRIQLFKCHGHANQRWTFVGQPDGGTQLVGVDGSCIGSVARDHELGLSPCNGPANRYRFDGGRLTELVTGTCVTASDFQNGARVFLDACSSSSVGQIWTIASPTAAAAEDAAGSARVREETAWNKARVTGCEFPVSLTGCDAVRIYLAKYPAGGHVEEANKALAAAQPQLERLQKDENAWTHADASTCRARPGTNACDGVDLYLVKFPAGAHAGEARQLVVKP